jgi:hypothetical protein
VRHGNKGFRVGLCVMIGVLGFAGAFCGVCLFLLSDVCACHSLCVCVCACVCVSRTKRKSYQSVLFVG